MAHGSVNPTSWARSVSIRASAAREQDVAGDLEVAKVLRELLDDVAADFPHLTVILAHPSVPWQAEAISMATHKANVFIDLSGWRPKYFPPELIQAANGLLRTKVMFGTDYPLITPERWLTDFELLPIDADKHERILKLTAAGVLGLS